MHVHVALSLKTMREGKALSLDAPFLSSGYRIRAKSGSYRHFVR